MSHHDPLAVDRLVRLQSEIDAKLTELVEIQGDHEFVREVAFIGEFKALKHKYQFTTEDAFTLLDPSRLFSPDLNVDNFFEQLQTVTSTKDQTGGHQWPGNPTVTPQPASAQATKGKGRPLLRYKNPLTGEVLETKGTNHKTLRNWKATHGRELVESWRES